jgi:hypothetical protein
VFAEAITRSSHNAVFNSPFSARQYVARMWARRPTWLVRSVVAAILVASMQYVLVAVPSVEPGLFNRSAVELQRTGSYRYGYIRRHGAILAKTRRSNSDAAFAARRPDDSIAPLMLFELRSRPVKATLELVFYAAVFAFCKAGMPRLFLGSGASRSRLRWSSSAAGAAAVFVTVLMAPYILAAYGEPLFSSLRGPGALTSSSLIPRTTTALMGPVSYGSVLDAVLLWPLETVQTLPGGLAIVNGFVPMLTTCATSWMVAAVFWAVAMGVAASVSFRPRARSIPADAG